MIDYLFLNTYMQNLINWQRSKICKRAIGLILGLLISLNFVSPIQAHWADLAVAEIQIKAQNVNINLTISI